MLGNLFLTSEPEETRNSKKGTRTKERKTPIIFELGLHFSEQRSPKGFKGQDDRVVITS